MKKFDYKKAGLGLMVIFVAVGLVGYFMKSKSKETIIDLGDGWKSYSHERLRFTVKIPGDAEIDAGIAGNKNEQFIARFSKGDIEYVRAYYVGSGSHDNPDDKEDVRRYFSGNYCKSWKYKSGTDEYQSWCEEVKINGKAIIVRFSEAIYESEMKLSFDDPRVLGKTEIHHISLKKEVTTNVEQRTKEHQNFTQEEIGNFVKEKTELIKELVVSINNF